jgi:hypothetical protein
VPNLKLPISAYLDWKELIDRVGGSRDIERRLVVDGYLHDPDFDRWYPLSAIMSLVSTPPPNRISELKTPTMFLVSRRGIIPPYIKELYDRLPPIKKRMVEVDGSVYWMLSHPKEAARVICEWFDETVGITGEAPLALPTLCTYSTLQLAAGVEVDRTLSGSSQASLRPSSAIGAKLREKILFSVSASPLAYAHSREVRRKR